MKIRSLGTALVTSVLLVSAVPTLALATPAAASRSACHPGTPATAPATTQFYDPLQPAMGPDPLPGQPPVSRLLIGYRRFGTLSETGFIAKYRSVTGWSYPPADGFLTVHGHVLRFEQLLRPGQRIDRFGYPGGRYLSPARTLFPQRALPPENLTTPASAPSSNYHVYCVLTAFDVDAGPIAPWFEQPGLGVQYKLEARYLPDAGTGLTVTWLLTHGYLVEERPGDALDGVRAG
jgi:hypothetical protein